MAGVSTGAYYLASFVAHYSLFMIFGLYIMLRVQTWESEYYDKSNYILSRFVVGFSLIPLVYLLGQGLKGLKNAEAYSVVVLYVSCWLIYNAFINWDVKLY